MECHQAIAYLFQLIEKSDGKREEGIGKLHQVPKSKRGMERDGGRERERDLLMHNTWICFILRQRLESGINALAMDALRSLSTIDAHDSNCRSAFSYSYSRVSVTRWMEWSGGGEGERSEGAKQEGLLEYVYDGNSRTAIEFRARHCLHSGIRDLCHSAPDEAEILRGFGKLNLTLFRCACTVVLQQSSAVSF